MESSAPGAGGARGRAGAGQPGEATDSTHGRVIAATAAFFLANLGIVLSGRADGGALCDDAFYYFQIARHAAFGHGFSFDGVFPTNGFHPLLAWLSVPIFRIFHGDPWVPIRIVQVLLAAAAAGTGYVLYRVGRAIGDSRAGELMAFFFFLSPFAWILPHRGCEGALSILCISLVAWQMARMSVAPITLRASAVLGALAGLAFLARTENIFWAVPVGAWFAWRVWRTRPPRPIRALLLAAGGALVVVAPWLLWNLARFGTVMQVSGAAKEAFHLYNPLPAVKGPRGLWSNVYKSIEHSIRFVAGEEYRPQRRTTTLLDVNAVLLAIAVTLGGRRRPVALFVPFAALVALHLLYYAVVQRSYFNWYFLPVALFAAVLQGERLARAKTWIASSLLVASALVCAATLLFFVERYGDRPKGAERELDGVLARLAEVPQGATVGGWNVGRIGYFGESRRPDLHFYNLDCVVNNQLFAAWRRGQYTEWVVDHVGWLIERPQGPLERRVVVPVGKDPLARVVRR